jgi:hypothetical protein
MTCGTVYSNPAIDALEQEMDKIRPNITKSVEDLKHYSKLREIRDSMRQQERNQEVIRQWEEDQKNLPCKSMYRQVCKRVSI